MDGGCIGKIDLQFLMNSNISNDEITRVAEQFSNSIKHISTLPGGLIHQTYRVLQTDGRSLVLQSINAHVFQKPAAVISNYLTLYQHLQARGFTIPQPIPSTNEDWLVLDRKGKYWRALQYMEHSFTKSIATQHLAREAAKCFASFVYQLRDLDTHLIQETIPHFHNLDYRYQQFTNALHRATPERILMANEWIQFIEKKQSIIEFFQYIKSEPAFRKRIMHHDCKTANILFHQQTEEVICPVDLDTTMPGYFFSDVGDIIRSMVPTQSEESINWKGINIEPGFYGAIIDGYLNGFQNQLTDLEIKHIHSAGILMIFMQGLRFLTDFLNHDIYYRVDYPNQNLDKARNQFLVLEALSNFLARQHNYSIG